MNVLISVPHVGSVGKFNPSPIDEYEQSSIYESIFEFKEDKSGRETSTITYRGETAYLHRVGNGYQCSYKSCPNSDPVLSIIIHKREIAFGWIYNTINRYLVIKAGHYSKQDQCQAAASALTSLLEAM